VSETRTLPLAAFTVKEAKPGTAFGQIARPALSDAASAAQELLLKVTLPTDLPPDAIITAAEIQVVPRETLTGTTTLTVRRLTSALKARVKWNNAPTYSGTATDSLTRTGSAAGVMWPFDVTADVQGFVAGTLTNYGWRLTTDATTARQFYGATAGKNQPVLELAYALPSEPPTDLMPTGGAVSVDKPVLTFTTPPGCIAVQVRIDPASDPATAWVSDEIAATAGVVDLATTTYPGLANGATTAWSARFERTDTGWSDWSDWFEFARVDQPALTLVSPDATPGDGTPTFSWTFTSQQAWRARLLSASGKVLDDSGEQAGTDTTWQPAKGLTLANPLGVAEVSARDDEVRIATPGAPTWVTTTLDLTFTPDDALVPLDSLEAIQPDGSPIVTLHGQRAEGIPDEVVIYRRTGLGDEEQVARVTGTDVFDGTSFAWSDATAPPNRVSEYRVVPVTGNVVGSDSPTATAIPTCTGLFLIDPDDLTVAVLYGEDEGDWSVEEIAVEHQPSNGESIRRRLFRSPPRGNAQGDIVDGPYQTADETMAALDAFAATEPDHVYRYVAGHENIAVKVSNVMHRPTPLSGPQDRHAIGGWSWRGTTEG
jgi:hypothetical protein